MPLIYKEHNNKLLPLSSLLAALHLPQQPHLVISLVGAGGKTNTMYQLADELSAMGKSVIVTTSTHIRYPGNRQVLITKLASGAAVSVKPGEVLVVGCTSGAGKLKGLQGEELERLSRLSDILLIEADGAKCLPLKIPGQNEPVITGNTHLVIACAGLDCIGRTYEDVCFRFKEAGGWLNKHCYDSLGFIRTGDLALILTDIRGAKKDVGNREYRIILNKADDELRKQNALSVISHIRPDERKYCVVTSYMDTHGL